jgi:hypothetical protein
MEEQIKSIMMNLWNDLKRMKIYMLVCAVGYTIYLVASLNGHKIIGDDNETELQTGTHTNGQRFYHK